MKKIIAFLMVLVSALCGCGTKSRDKFSALIPTGAPLIAMANVLELLDYEITIGPDLIQTALVKGEKDFVVAPLLTATNLYQNGHSNYILGAIVGWSNLHLLSREEMASPRDLNGKRILAFGEHTTPGVILRIGTKHDDVDITYYKAINDVVATFIDGQYDYALTSEPFLSKVLLESEETLYHVGVEDFFSLDRIVQFGIFIKPDLPRTKLKILFNELDTSLNNAKNEPEVYASSIVNKDRYLQNLGTALIATSFNKSGFEFVAGGSSKSAVKDFLLMLNKEESSIGGLNLDDEFFYE